MGPRLRAHLCKRCSLSERLPPASGGLSPLAPSPISSPSRTTISPTPPSGQLSLNEFMEGARRDKWVMKMLQMDVNPSGWISQQRRKSAMF